MDATLRGIVGRRRPSKAQLARWGFYGAGGLLGALFLSLAILTRQDRTQWGTHFATDWLLAAVLVSILPVGYFQSREIKRIQAIDATFPDFLRDIAESARSGMTLPRALSTASTGAYGPLTDEIRVMTAQVEWGVSFEEVFARFAKRTRTPLIERTVSLIIEAQRSGGSVVDVLTAASEDARELKLLHEERSGHMQVYGLVIWVSFLVFIAVTLILVMQFIPAFADAARDTGGGSVGGFSFRSPDSDAFTTLFFQAAIVQAIGGGLITGQLTKGRVSAGIPTVLWMVAIAWFCFRVIAT